MRNDPLAAMFSGITNCLSFSFPEQLFAFDFHVELVAHFHQHSCFFRRIGDFAREAVASALKDHFFDVYVAFR